MEWPLWGAMAAALATTPLAARTPVVSAARNLDFEQGQPGEVPPGWSAAAALKGGFTATLTGERPHGGQACLEIRRDQGGMWPICPVRQALAASPYRGRRVRLLGWARFERSDLMQATSSARMWIRVGGHPQFYEDLGERPVRAAEWTFAQLVCQVAPDADSIAFGCALDGYGRAWFDDLKLADLGPSGEGNEPARPLDERGMENLVAFGRLLGYARHFHPSDEAATTDWESFAIAGVDEVESALTPADLKARLERLFRPLAPPLRLSTKPLRQLTVADLRGRSVEPERITGWQHRGWPDPYRMVYNERRVVAPAQAPGDSMLPIGSEVNTALGGGVSCSVPLTLFVDARGTVPRGTGGAPTLRRPDGWVPSGNDRATRLADVLLFWNVAQHFFPYFDVIGTDWPAQLPSALRAAAADSNGATFEQTLKRLAATLHDGHVFAWSRDYRDPSDAPQWPFAWSFVEGRLVITRVDSTHAGGARAGDEVIAIQGRPASQWEKDAEAVSSAATLPRLRIHVARTMASMIDTDTLALDLRSPAGVTRHVRMTPRGNDPLAPARPDSVSEVRPGVVYVDMSRITDEDLLAVLPKINAGKGVVFDLRGYLSRAFTVVVAHLTDSTVTSARWCIPIVLRPDHRDTTCACSSWIVTPEPPRIRARAAFLIDARAMSASETLLGIVEHFRLAELVGEPTGGTNGNVTTVKLPGGYDVNFTGMKVLKQDGSRHHGLGILPTVRVSPTIAGIAAGRDEQLEKAIGVVSH